MASGKPRGLATEKLWEVIERSASSFVRHDMVVYATTLAYRGLFALFPSPSFSSPWSASWTSTLSSDGSRSRDLPGYGRGSATRREPVRGGLRAKPRLAAPGRHRPGLLVSRDQRLFLTKALN